MVSSLAGVGQEGVLSTQVAQIEASKAPPAAQTPPPPVREAQQAPTPPPADSQRGTQVDQTA